MKDLKLKHLLALAFLILISSLAIVVSIKLYQGLTSQMVTEALKTTAITFYILSLIAAGGFLVGSSVFLALQWSSKTKDQNNELISTMTEIIKRQEHILPPPPQNFTLNLKTTEHKSVALTPEEEEKEQENKKLLHNNHNNKEGIY